MVCRSSNPWRARRARFRRRVSMRPASCRRRTSTPAGWWSGGLGGRARPGLEPRDELVEAELLEALCDGVELACAELDQAAALLAELERLPQAGLAGVEAADDLLDAGAG